MDETVERLDYLLGSYDDRRSAILRKSARFPSLLAKCSTEYYTIQVNAADSVGYLEFIYTKAFITSAKNLLDEEALRALEQSLVADPEKGAIEKGTGGVRKVRFALEGKGKSGGARVVYFYLQAKGKIYLLLAYPKNEKAALTGAERNLLYALAKQLKEE